MAQTNTKTVRRKRKVRLLTRNGQYYDYNLLACVVLLTCFGLIMLYSTSAYDAQVEYGSDTYFLFRQALFSVGGLAAIFVFSMIDYHFYARYAGYFYLFSNLLLLVTKFIGHEVNGAKRWIKIGPIQFQSAEPAKLAIILFLSVLIVQFGKKLKGFKAPAVLFAFGALTFLLTWKFTENLSTAIIILGITCALIFVAHPKTAPFVLTAGIGLPVGIVGVRGYVSSLGASGNFRFNRVLAWIDPEKYSDGGGYQVLQFFIRFSKAVSRIVKCLHFSIFPTLPKTDLADPLSVLVGFRIQIQKHPQDQKYRHFHKNSRNISERFCHIQCTAKTKA